MTQSGKSSGVNATTDAAAPRPAAAGDARSSVMRHADHDPALPCRPAGNGLCEPAPEGAVLVGWREALDVNQPPG